MHKIVEIDGKIHIQDSEGNLITRNNRPVWFSSMTGANRELKRLNKGKSISTRKVKGVIDNRHRNWRRRK